MTVVWVIRVRCKMTTYWSAIFSSAWRVKRALFAWFRTIVGWGRGERFSSKTPAARHPAKAAELSGRFWLPISEDLSDLSDVLAACQRMSDWLRLGIKNEAEGYGLIPLTQGKFAIVDAEDYDWLIRYKWHACKCKNTYYASRVRGGKTIKMHREIMRAPKGLVCDHINHNGLDNRKRNLRLCTNAQNCYNQRASATGTSKYKGVSWHKSAVANGAPASDATESSIILVTLITRWRRRWPMTIKRSSFSANSPGLTSRI